MATNKVTIVLNAEDNASQKIRDVMRGIEQATSRGTMAGTLMGNAFTKAFELAEKAVGGLVNQLGKAEESYQSAIKTSQVYVNQFGGTLQQGQDAVYKMQAELARQAAVLPGSAEDYASVANAIMDNVFQTSTNAEEAMKIVSDISIKIGSRFTKSAGITDAQRIRLSERLMTDNLSIKSMERLMPFMQDASLRSAMRKAEIAFGTSFADAVGKKRQAMVLSALDYVQSDAVIDAASKTMGSSLEQIKDRLFGMYNGLFGVRRDLDQTKEGEQSLYTKIGEFLGTFINLANTIGKITNQLGLGSDPMAALGAGLDNLSKFLADVDKALQPFASGDKIPKLDGLIKLAGGGMADLFNKFLDSAIGVLKNADGVAIGNAIGDFLGGLVLGIGEFLTSIDYGKLLVAFGMTVNRVLDIGTVALVRVLLSIGEATNAALKKTVDAAVSAIGRFGGDLISGIVNWIKNLVGAIGDKFKSVLAPIGAALGVGTGDMFASGKTGNSFMPSAGDSITAPTLPSISPPAPKVAAPAPLFDLKANPGLFNPTINLQSNATDPREVANIAIAELGRQYQNYKLGMA